MIISTGSAEVDRPGVAKAGEEMIKKVIKNAIIEYFIITP
jgi:hypothetical protein